jgi:cobalamin biosynthesis protein CobT
VGRIEIENVLDVETYQNDVALVQQQVDVELETTLEHPQHILEEVSDDEIMLNVEEEINEDEECDESFEEEEWDDENETSEEGEWENIHETETSEEEEW